MKKQRVVRTHPPGWFSTGKSLADLLAEGYTIVCCNQVDLNSKQKGLEYIVEKEVVE